jgi:hypothetical protein
MFFILTKSNEKHRNDENVLAMFQPEYIKLIIFFKFINISDALTFKYYL